MQTKSFTFVNVIKACVISLSEEVGTCNCVIMHVDQSVVKEDNNIYIYISSLNKLFVDI